MDTIITHQPGKTKAFYLCGAVHCISFLSKAYRNRWIIQAK